MRAVSWVAVTSSRSRCATACPTTWCCSRCCSSPPRTCIGQLTAGQDVKIIKDLGLAATRSSGCSSRSSSASAWSRRRSSAAASTPARQAGQPRRSSSSASTPGLVLTLAVNVAVMTAALYLVLAYLTWVATPERRGPAWDAPGRRPGACSKAIGLIFIELMVVTAVALLFSTFSTPLLAAAFTFGLYVAGHFNADLRNFEAVVDSPAAVWLARGRITCCRTCRPSTSRPRWCMACPCRSDT
jgi:hypothetical protein